LPAASDTLLSEPTIIARTADAVLKGRTTVPWLEMGLDYDLIRDRIARVVPGFDKFNEKVREPGGFYLRSSARELNWATDNGRANFATHELSCVELEEGQLLLQTLRSHDQFNTTVYGLDDRYRGISNERRVIFMNPSDMKVRGIGPMEEVHLTSHFEGEKRYARHYLAVPYDLPTGACAGYFPELNVLVPLRSYADVSLTPTSKSVRVTIEPAK
jgi:anaerobic selenocysteine-containing dehydrogenase